MKSDEERIKWRVWIDGPRGLAISGSLQHKGVDYELCAHVGKPEDARSRVHYLMPRHQAMRQIRCELLGAVS
jgi:glucuronate isomerase